MVTPRATDAQATSDDCAHHWVIETPNGASSQGRCKLCGAMSQFRNSSEELPWMDERYQASVRRGHRSRKAS